MCHHIRVIRPCPAQRHRVEDLEAPKGEFNAIFSFFEDAEDLRFSPSEDHPALHLDHSLDLAKLARA
jgi:hypothetical protein